MHRIMNPAYKRVDSTVLCVRYVVSLSPSLSPDCELVALLEDDTGMELLVCNKIISLDLPVKEVYKKIWCAQQNVSE